MNTIINKFSESVNKDAPAFSCVRYYFLRGTNSLEFFECETIDNNNTTARSADEGVYIGLSVGSFSGHPTNGYIYTSRVPGETYPRICPIDIYPKENLTAVRVNRISEIDEFCPNLKTLYVQNCDLVQDGGGNIGQLASCTSLEVLHLTPSRDTTRIYGNVASLSPLVNLTYINFKGSDVTGDLKEMLDAMHESGRNSGTIEVHSGSNRLRLTYGGDVLRILDTYDDSGTIRTIYGWKFAFSDEGWSVVETYNSYV